VNIPIFSKLLNRNYYRLSRVSLALAQISCYLFQEDKFLLVHDCRRPKFWDLNKMNPLPIKWQIFLAWTR